MDDYYKRRIKNNWMEGLPDQVTEERGKHCQPERQDPVFTKNRPVPVAIPFQQVFAAGRDIHIVPIRNFLRTFRLKFRSQLTRFFAEIARPKIIVYSRKERIFPTWEDKIPSLKPLDRSVLIV